MLRVRPEKETDGRWEESSQAVTRVTRCLEWSPPTTMPSVIAEEPPQPAEHDVNEEPPPPEEGVDAPLAAEALAAR